MVPWTANDLDTLRHEAHHLIQDCADGVPFDGDLVTMFDPRGSKTFVVKALSQDVITGIIEGYAEMGADREVIILELEAYATAESIEATDIAEKIEDFCPMVDS